MTETTAPNPDAFSLRPATTDDLATLVEIEARCHKAPWSRDHFEAELDKPFARLLLLTDDETDRSVGGYISYALLDGCSIQNVVVDLPFRGLGLGERLVRQAVREALRAGLERARLEVRKSNEGAIALYQKTGFSITRIQKGFYSDGEDACVMELDLTGAEPVEF